MSYKTDYATSRRSVKKQQDIRLQDLHKVNIFSLKNCRVKTIFFIYKKKYFKLFILIFRTGTMSLNASNPTETAKSTYPKCATTYPNPNSAPTFPKTPLIPFSTWLIRTKMACSTTTSSLTWLSATTTWPVIAPLFAMP